MSRRVIARDYTRELIWAAVVVTTARYIGAFVASDVGEITGPVSSALTILMGITGVGMGLLDTIGGVYIFEGWRKTLAAHKAGQKWSARFKVQSFFVFGLFGVGLIILTPFTASRVLHESIEHVLGDRTFFFWVWNIAVNVAPYMILGGAVTGQPGFVGVDHRQESGAPGTASGQQVSSQFPQVAEGGRVGTLALESGAASGQRVSGQMEARPNDWRQVSTDEKRRIAGMRAMEVKEEFGIPERTASNWVRYARELFPDVAEPPSGNGFHPQGADG